MVANAKNALTIIVVYGAVTDNGEENQAVEASRPSNSTAKDPLYNVQAEVEMYSQGRHSKQKLRCVLRGGTAGGLYTRLGMDHQEIYSR